MRTYRLQMTQVMAIRWKVMEQQSFLLSIPDMSSFSHSVSGLT